jgi:tetratricopeptide (TPR) repeat protein
MRNQNFEATESWLLKIKNPESSLVKKQVGYYNYLLGIINSQRNLTQAEKFFRKAISYGIYQITLDNIGNGIALIFLSLIFILLYFKNEILIIAFLKMRNQNFEATESWLLKIKNPESSLVKKQVGYYNYLLGIINSQRNLTQAEKFFRKAISYGLNMNQDLAMAKLSLAGIMMQKRRKREATNLLNEAKKLDKHGILVQQIKMMQTQMKRI